MITRGSNKGNFGRGQDEDQRPSWELIGKEEYGKQYFEKVPKWVRVELANLQTKHSWSDLASEGRYLVIRGKHFSYKITPAGQGGPITYIERRPRG